MKSLLELEQTGFTEAGRTRYIQTVDGYAEALVKRASDYGQADRGKDLPLEITHEHVRQSAYSIASSYGKDRPSRWNMAGHIGEYVFTAIAGISGGNISSNWGPITFGVSLAFAVILIVFRLSRPK